MRREYEPKVIVLYFNGVEEHNWRARPIGIFASFKDLNDYLEENYEIKFENELPIRASYGSRFYEFSWQSLPMNSICLENEEEIKELINDEVRCHKEYLWNLNH